MTQHKIDCKMSFGRKDDTCPRCRELLNGAPARSSWHKKHFDDQKKKHLQIINHNCVSSGCGVVCTAFDY